MRWLVGLVSVLGCAVSFHAHAQVPPVPPPANATFPADAPPTSPLPPPPPAGPPAPTSPPPVAPTGAEPPPVELEGSVQATPSPPAAPATTTAPPPPAPATTTPQAPTPPPELDLRSNRERRPFFIGGELGWNGLAGLGVNFSYHPHPHLAIDTGAGLSLTGWRISGRVRGNLLKSEWTPFIAAGMSYATGLGDADVELESKGEKAKLRVLPSPFLQIGGGVNYTGREGFAFTATTGYSILLRDYNTRFASGSRDTYDDVKAIYDGGLIISVAFGYAF